MTTNYWRGALEQRLTRRRGLALAGGAAATAAFLAACGGGSSDGGKKAEEKDASGLLTKAQNSTSAAKQGGTFPYFIGAEVITMDPLNNASSGTGVNNQALAYSRFLQWKPGILENPI